MPEGRCCEDADAVAATAGASLRVESAATGRKPCCRRRGGGGGALVEPAVLAALLAAGGHGYDLRRIIQERTGGALDVDVGGLYRALRRLEEDGAVTSEWSEDESGPRRREYEVTEQGVEIAEQWLEALRQRQRLNDLLVSLLEGGLAEAEEKAKRLL